MDKILAIDIGGTAVKYCFFADKNEFGKLPVVPLGEKEDMPELILSIISKYNAENIGISAPGPFDFTSGTSLMNHKLLSLYKISLDKRIKEIFPNAKITFIHDSTSFAVGAMHFYPELNNKNFACIMLGTGLGYANVKNHKVELNNVETPLHPLWNKPIGDKIAENFVSATAIKTLASNVGDYSKKSVFEICNEARSGNLLLQKIFWEMGENLGKLMTEKQKEDTFCEIVLGGGVSLSWDLFKNGFESVCNIPYRIIGNPNTYPLYGVLDCVKKGKSFYCNILEA